MTQEEARMASAEQLKMTHCIDGKVTGVDDRVRGVQGQVGGVRGDMQDVRGDVQGVGNRVQDVDDRVQGIDSNVRDIDNKLDQSNRSLSFRTLIIILRTQKVSQATSSEIVSYDGFRRQIRPPIITLHVKPVTTVQPIGFAKEVYSIIGNPLGPYCGCTENVGYFCSLPCDNL